MRLFAALGSKNTPHIARIAALCLLAALGSCGFDSAKNEYNITLNGHSVVWAGYASSDQRLKGGLDAAVVCLRANGLRTRPGDPLVIVVDGTFNCNGILARGCAQIGGASIYITEEYLYTAVFTHEIVHWETGMGNEYHNTPLFETCCSTADL
jgi:hypothetical protein